MAAQHFDRSAVVLYALGSNGSGQLGIGCTDDVARPQRCSFRCLKPGNRQKDIGGREIPFKVKEIVAGGNHTLLLTVDGRVFTAGEIGASEDGLSAEFQERRLDIDATSGPSIVSHIAATWEASFFVVGGNSVYVCGSGAKGELGLGKDVVETKRLTKVLDVAETMGDIALGQDQNNEIVAISACMSHVVVLVSDGRVFGWGSCRKGQLGDELKPDKVLWQPRRIDVGLSFRPEKVVVGREYTVFLSAGERPLICGTMKGFDERVLQHSLQDGDVVVSGWSSIHILSSAGVISTGKNHYGQLSPANLPPLRLLAAGSEHCIGLTQDGQTVAWGWGEHGNCGETLEEYVADQWNVIPLPSIDGGIRVRTVAAGCATSFVVCERDT
jgi:protein ATS1